VKAWKPISGVSRRWKRSPTAFEGVEQSYALQAGREVRIIVRPETVDDLAALRLSRDIAKKIEETMQYPPVRSRCRSSARRAPSNSAR